MSSQTFIDGNNACWQPLAQLPGTALLPLAAPIPEGSIHRLKMVAGTIIPTHVHPCDEYVQVLTGTIETSGTLCEAGCFWHTPAGTRQGPHKALTDVELLTIRLGAMGTFDSPFGADES